MAKTHTFEWKCIISCDLQTWEMIDTSGNETRPSQPWKGNCKNNRGLISNSLPQMIMNYTVNGRETNFLFL